MKNKLLIYPFIFFLIILSIFFYLLVIDRNPYDVPSALIDRKVPNFITESLFKKEKFISTKEFDNKIVLVNFFATWCKPCRDEHKYIKKFSKNKKIKVIGINYKDDAEKAKNWLNKLGNPYTIVGIDKRGKIAIDWGVYGIPETFVVNSRGFVKFKYIGPITKKKYRKINSIINNMF